MLNQILLASQAFKATGGTITSDATYMYHTFLSSENFVVESGSAAIDYLIIGGGGTGQGFQSGSPTGGIGGGGGAGDYIEKFGSIIAGGAYPVVVAQAKAGVGNGTGLNGDNSSFKGDTALGGGAGGGADGGCGGGAVGRTPGQFGAGGAALGVNGKKGGDHLSSGGWGAGGGGGTGGVGAPNSGNQGGAGGTGSTSALLGVPFCYGGGGAAESGSGGTGYGYGGNGASGGGGGGGSAGGYGCGGGGARNNGGTGGAGGNGGRGIVVIRYKKI